MPKNYRLGDDDTLLLRKFPTRDEARNFVRRLLAIGYKAHVTDYQGTNMIWCEGIIDQRKAIEAIEAQNVKPPDYHENVVFGMEVCSKLKGGCQNCPRITECVNWYDGRVTCHTANAWDKEHYQRLMSEFTFYRGSLVVK